MSEVMIKGPQDRINWLIVAAFRYCVGRHTTQAMYGVGDVILDNLDVLHTEFIKQFIREIEHEQYVTELDQGRNKRYEIDFFARLKTHIKDYQRDLKDEKGEKQQELYKLLCQVMELIPQVDMLHKWPAWEWRIDDTNSKMEKVRGFENVTGSTVKLPIRKTESSAGYDFIAPHDIVVPARGSSNVVFTGIKAYMPKDEYLQLHIRSSLAIKAHLALACGGIIDADYYNNADNEGNIGIAFVNHSDIGVVIKAGERMAQGIFVKYGVADGDVVKTKRTGGFGSTGTR